MDLDPLVDPLRQPELRDGVRYGVPALAAGVLIGIAWRRGRRAPAPVAGLALAAAGALVVGVATPLRRDVLIGLGALAGLGLVADLVRLPAPLVLVLAAPGAWWLVYEGELAPDGDWRRPLLFAGVAVGGALVADVDRRDRSAAIGPPAMLVTAGGVYACVPDTEQALALLGAALLVAPLGWPVRLARLGQAGSLAVTGLVVVVVALGGVGADRALVGGVASLGGFLVEPLATRLGGPRRQPHDPGWPAAALLAAHLAVVLYASRVAGVRDEPGTAGVLAVAGATVAVVAGAAVQRARRARR